MAEMLEYRPEQGAYRRIIRDDAVRLRNPDRWYVPTRVATKWVTTWEEFSAAGGKVAFSEDQAEVELLLPVPYKFSIHFMQGKGQDHGAENK